MPPEHTQQSANAGHASLVPFCLNSGRAGPKPSVLHSHRGVGELLLMELVRLFVDALHLMELVHLFVGELHLMELEVVASALGLYSEGQLVVPLVVLVPHFIKCFDYDLFGN